MAEKLEQLLTDYEPSDTEKRLLEVLMNPENRNKSVTDICQLANISRTTYYNIFEKPEFIALKRKWEKKLISSKTTAIIHAFQREALRGSFQHGKVLLEMDDMYAERVKQEITGKDGGPIKTETVNPIDYSNLTDDEVKILTENKAWVADPVKAKEIAQMLLTNKVNE